MLQHLHTRDRVKPLAARRHLAAGFEAIFHRLPGAVRFRRLQRAFREINPQHRRAAFRQRLAQNTAAAAHIQHAQAGQIHKTLHELQTRGINLMQRAVRPLHIPKRAAVLLKTANIGGKRDRNHKTSSKRFERRQQYNANQRDTRHLIKKTIKHMTAAICPGGKGAVDTAANDLVGDQPRD